MKKAIIFVICMIVVVYAAVAVLTIDFGFITSSAKADDVMILRYLRVDNDGEFIDDGSENIHTQTVSLYLNKKTGAVETKAKNAKLAGDNLFSNPGHKFAFWTIDGKKYKAGDWVPGGLTGGTVDVLSSWTVNTVSITFDAQYGTPTPSRQTVFYGERFGEVISLLDGKIERPNYEFGGWWTAPGGSGTQITADSIVSFDQENVTLYAHWTHKGGTETVKYKVNYHANNNSGMMQFQEDFKGTHVIIKNNEFVWKDYKFIGWALKTNGPVVYQGGAEIYLVENIDLFAKWEYVGDGYVEPDVYYKVTFDKNGGSSASWSEEIVKGGTIKLPNYTGTRSGYVFGGWNTNAAGTGTTYAVNSNFTVSAAQTFYAKWNKGENNGDDGDTNVPGSKYTVSGAWTGLSRGSGNSITEGTAVHGANATVTFCAGVNRCVMGISVTGGAGGWKFIDGGYEGMRTVTVQVTNVTSSVTVTATVAANEYVKYDSVRYEIFNNRSSAKLAGYYGQPKYIDILRKTVTVENVSNIPVVGINDYAFKDCTSLTGELDIWGHFKTIGEGAFMGCTGIQKVFLYAGVETIQIGAFSGCSNLTGSTSGDLTGTMIIPATVTGLGNNAFWGTKINGLWMKRTTPTTILNAAPAGTSNPAGFPTTILYPAIRIIVPNSALTEYKNAAVWSWYKNGIYSESQAVL